MSFGPVPSIKYSLLVLDPSLGRPPNKGSIWRAFTLSGLSIIPSLYFFNSCPISVYQIGEAPVEPDVTRGSMTVLSLFPTHTPTVIPFVKPTAQLSFLSLVVPVLTATVLPGMLRYEFKPNASDRALLSDRI